VIIKLKNVRLAFCQNLFKPGVMPGSAADAVPKYSSTFLIPKNDPQVKTVQEAINAVALAKWEKKAAVIGRGLVAENKVCLHDGDLKEQYDGFSGSMYVGASNKVKPLVIDKDRTELVESSGKPYAGCYVNCSLEVWAQDNQFGKRINATLRGVQFLRDGDAFVGGAPATDDEFEDIGDTGAEDIA